MFGLFEGLVKYIKPRQVSCDNFVDSLYYRYTFTILVVFCIVISTSQYVGTPIECIPGNTPKDVLNLYCWITQTFTKPAACDNEQLIGKDKPHPCMDTTGASSERKRHAYYQWVPFVLFLQALIFHLPGRVWEAGGASRIKLFAATAAIQLVPDEERRIKKKLISQYMTERMSARKDAPLFTKWISRNKIFVSYLIIELVMFFSVLVQMYFLNLFFNNEFMTYGLRVIEFSQMDDIQRTDPMVFMFPRVTKCFFHQFGPSGEIEKDDSICVLPLNIVNEKIYIFLWFWFCILLVLMGIVIIIRIGQMLAPSIRLHCIKTNSMANRIKRLDLVIRHIARDDWLILYMLGDSTDPLFYREILQELEDEMTTFDPILRSAINGNNIKIVDSDDDDSEDDPKKALANEKSGKEFV